MNRLRKRIDGTENWLVLQSSLVPYIIGIGLRQWTEGVVGRYPDYPLMSFCGARSDVAGSVGHFIADLEEYDASFRKLLDNISVLETIYQDFLRYEKRFIKIASEMDRQDDVYLAEHYDEFLDAYDDEYISAVIADGALTYGETFVESMMTKYPDRESEIRVLISPFEESFSARYRRDLLEAALRVLGSPEDAHETEMEREITLLRDAYHWMHNNYKNVEKISSSFFRNELSEAMNLGTKAIGREIEELSSSVSDHAQACEEIRERGVFAPTDYERLLWLGKYASWVDRRKRCNLLANHLIGRYLRHVCETHRLSYDDAAFLLPEELKEVVDGRMTLSDFPIEARKRGGICFYDVDGQRLFLVGEETDALWKRISEDASAGSEDGSVLGRTGYGGRVSGRARIVLDAHDPGDFRDGDILVTGMTRPDFVPLMKRAGAIVTNEGGITCHAAIVARELKKPCVIGTKIATQVLRDGDLVEVDADRGVARVLEHAEKAE